jgi:hypothetical protein
MQARFLNCADVDEYVLPAALGCYEPERFARLNHFTLPFGIVGILVVVRLYFARLQASDHRDWLLLSEAAPHRRAERVSF